MRGHIAVIKLPVTSYQSYSLLNHPVSPEEYSTLTHHLMQIYCSTRSVILNVGATQYTCSPNWCLPPPLTSTVKLSLFTHVHSSPLSLAARLHQCHANHSCYINNGWTFSRQISDIVKQYFLSTCPLIVYICDTSSGKMFKTNKIALGLLLKLCSNSLLYDIKFTKQVFQLCY